jgi:hypothetical protein
MKILFGRSADNVVSMKQTKNSKVMQMNLNIMALPGSEGGSLAN